MPLVSVLMAVYNAAPWLDQALRSLLSQSLQDIEILAVDDASTDRSLQMLLDYAERDSRVRVFRQSRNQGQAVARNLALRHARGQYVCMVDADDWLSPDALRDAVAVFSRHPQTDCVVFRLVFFHDATSQFEDYPMPPLPTASAASSASPFYTGFEAFTLSLDWTLHGLYLVRRELHIRYPYDDSLPLYSDDNTTRLHYLHSREVRLCPGIYYYRKHAQSATTAVTERSFLYMQANLGMKRTLESEGLPAETLARYELHRWHNFLSQLWLYYAHRRSFDPSARKRIRREFRSIYQTFHRRRPFLTVYAEQYLRWLRRRLLS